MLATVDAKGGRPRGAVENLTIALDLRLDDFSAWVQLSRIYIDAFEPEDGAEFSRGWHDLAPSLFARKIHFYPLSALFVDMRAKHGPDAATHWAVAPFESPAGREAVDAVIRGRGSDLDRFAGALVEDRWLTRAINALGTGDPGDAVRAVSAFLSDAHAPRDQLERILLDGPDAGHPVWHVINPYFHLWAAGNLDAAGSQSHWRGSRAISQGVESWAEIQPRYQAWIGGGEAGLIRRSLADISEELRRPPRILDLGCGVGTFLRHAVENCDVPVENVAGVDLHESQIASVREGLLELADASDQQFLAGIVADNLVAGDLLDLDMASLKQRHPDLDLVTLFAVSGCFDDEQFSKLLASTQGLNARYLMVRTVGKSWNLWRGREDEDDYYARIGYELVQQDWLPEPLPEEGLIHILAPRKYWANSRLVLYRRVD